MPRVVPSDVVAVIDRMFPKLVVNRRDAPNITFDNLPELVALARLVESISEELLTLSPNQYALLISSTAYLRALPDALQAAGSNQLGPGWTNTLSLRPHGFDENVISLIRAAMVACPDEAPSPGTGSLAFIADSPLRENIRLDISGANRDLAQGEWKGATVLAGAAVEALLLWVLQQHEQAHPGSIAAAGDALVAAQVLGHPPNSNPERWDLHEYVEVVAHLQLIEVETATQARQARNFRNLIHPGRAARLGQKCDRGTALSALAAVELVVRDLNTAMTKSNIPGQSLLKRILDPHTELACDLLNMVKSRSSGDPTHRFQIAGLMVFLAGLDKVLSLTLEVLYVAGRVDWKWLSGNRSPDPGQIVCRPGLIAKLLKIRDLGLDLTEVGWLVELRNWYVHDCGIYAGYRVDIEWTEPPRPHLRAVGPEVSTSGVPLAGIDATTIKTYSDDMAKLLGSLLDRNGWSAAWRGLQERLSQLPADPEPELSRIGPGGPEDIAEVVTSLNARFLGDGLSKIL